jgi:hypothetical protein
LLLYKKWISIAIVSFCYQFSQWTQHTRGYISVISDVGALKRQFFTAHVVAALTPLTRYRLFCEHQFRIKGWWIYIPGAAVPGRIRGCEIKLKASVDDAESKN